MLLSEAMSDVGMTPALAASGEEALDVLSRNDPFDLLITDIQLLGPVDGLDIARAARGKAPGMPIIFTTGQPDRMAHWKSGASDLLIPKPYRPSDIIAGIQKMTNT